MSDPADKSDDLIAELAKLMATPAAAKPASAPVQAPGKAAPVDGKVGATPPRPVRIPGMDTATASPIPVRAAPAPSPAPAGGTPSSSAAPARAPATGSIRIPGMDQPAPVSTSAPVPKFDFGKPVTAEPIKQESLATLADRIAARAAEAEASSTKAGPVSSPPAAPERPSSDPKPVSENRSFGEGPILPVARTPSSAPAKPITPAAPVVPVANKPAAPAAPSVPSPAVPPAHPPTADPAPPASAPSAAEGDFHFDFGFDQNPPEPANSARPAADPIADLIEADLSEHENEAEAGSEAEAEPQPNPAPVVRIPAVAQDQSAKPAAAAASPAPPRPISNAPVPLKPASAAPRPPEADQFAISPGVGLNLKPPSGQPLGKPAPRPEPEPVVDADETDPMAEIESLIGEAVRVELSPGPVRVQAPQQPVAPKVALEPESDVEEEVEAPRDDAGHSDHEPAAPVVPPLGAQFAPRRSGLKDDAGTASAEAAILAATADGAVGGDTIEPVLGDDSPYRRLKVKPQRAAGMSGGARQYVGIAVAVVLLLAIGMGLYWVFNMTRPADVTGADAPQLTADTTPNKVLPEPPANTNPDKAHSPVLEQMAGTAPPPSAEQIISTDQTKGNDVTQVAEADNATTEGGLANRKVRTVTVRPDGTIVSGDDAVAGTEELPVDRPNVPALPSAGVTNLLGEGTTQVAATTPPATTPAAPETIGSTDATATEGDGASDVAAADDGQPVIDEALVAPTPMTFPIDARTTARTAELMAPPKNTSVNALIGAQTPNGQIDLLGGGTPIQTQPRQQAAPAPTATVTAAAYVQLSSTPDEKDAASAVRAQTAKFGSLFEGGKLIVQSADLGARGIWYRVRLPVNSLSDASRICAEIKANGGDCIATNG